MQNKMEIHNLDFYYGSFQALKGDQPRRKKSARLQL